MAIANLEVSRDVSLEVRDGTILRCDVYSPAGSGAYPALLRRTPYRKERWEPEARALAARGYVVVVQDIRGRNKSDGDFAWIFADQGLTCDADDGYDTVEWAATLPKTNGLVGVWGHSNDAWCCWMLAKTQPPHLKAIAPTGLPPNLLDFTHGVLDVGRRFEWMYYTIAPDLRRRAGTNDGPITEPEATQYWREDERGKWIWFIPFDEIPDEVFSTLTPKFKKYLREMTIEFFHFDQIHHRINVPTLLITGWWDRCIHTVDHFTGLQKNGPAELNGHHRLVVGPWSHNETLFKRELGPVDNGPFADVVYEDMIGDWFDLHLKGIDKGIGSKAPVRIFVIGEGVWRDETEWPLARTNYRDLFLHSRGTANTIQGNGSLGWECPVSEPPDTYEYDPRDPIMSLFADNGQMWPRDQRPNNHRRDNLIYVSPVLDEPLEITGPIILKLWAESDAPDTDWTAKLNLARGDGLTHNLTYGIARARYRHGFDRPALLEPDTPHEYTIRLGATSVLLKPGDRLRLDISSSDFPNFDRNHNTGAE